MGKGISKLILCLFCFDSFGAISLPKTNPPKVRVRIAKSIKKVLVSGKEMERRLHLKDDFKMFPGNKTVLFDCSKINKSNNKKSVMFASLNSKSGVLKLKDNFYSGKIHVTTSANHKSCDVVNEVSLEKYISSLLSKEMNNKWPVEALKAQAIAARTYAIHKMESKQVSRGYGFETYFDLESSEKHQVSGGYFDTTQSTMKASRGTKGEVLVSPSGKLKPIFFHAKCGGKTLRPDQVWTNLVEGYREVDCPYCDSHGTANWKSRITAKRLTSFLKWTLKKKKINMKEVVFAPDRFSKNKIRAYVGQDLHLIEKSQFRRYFGRFIVKSNNFHLEYRNSSLKLSGKGLGHGVGLCQLGALDLAQRGWGYKQILSHYFPNYRLKKLY